MKVLILETVLFAVHVNSLITIGEVRKCIKIKRRLCDDERCGSLMGNPKEDFHKCIDEHRAQAKMLMDTCFVHKGLGTIESKECLAPSLPEAVRSAKLKLFHKTLPQTIQSCMHQCQFEAKVLCTNGCTGELDEETSSKIEECVAMSGSQMVEHEVYGICSQSNSTLTL